MKYEQYITESTAVNRFGKFINKYKSDMKKIQDTAIKQADFFINQVKDLKELTKMYDLLDTNDETQQEIAHLVDTKMYELEEKK